MRGPLKSIQAAIRIDHTTVMHLLIGGALLALGIALFVVWPRTAFTLFQMVDQSRPDSSPWSIGAVVYALSLFGLGNMAVAFVGFYISDVFRKRG